MRYLLWFVLCLTLGLCGVALADDMDGQDGVVRDEHAAPPAEKQDKKEKQDKQQPKQAEQKPAAPQHSQEGDAPHQVGDPNTMGTYFGLGDEFIWSGSDGSAVPPGLPESRMIPGNPPDRETIREAAQKSAADQADAVGFDQENHLLLRRGPHHDYFYD